MAKKVLIVEDEGVVRERIIQSVRWSKDLILTGEAANGEEALQMCRENMPDIRKMVSGHSFRTAKILERITMAMVAHNVPITTPMGSRSR